MRVAIFNERFLESFLEISVSSVEGNVPSMDVCVLFYMVVLCYDVVCGVAVEWSLKSTVAC